MKTGSNVRSWGSHLAVAGCGIALSAFLCLSLGGCNFKTASASGSGAGKPVASSGAAVAPAISPQTATVVQAETPTKLQPKPANASAPAVENALEKAHQDFLNAYERYVQLLRESGPHAMETLNALADYQKKYQLYQRMHAATLTNGQ